MSTPPRRLLLRALLGAAGLPVLPVLALEAPKERPVLTISGKIGVKNAGHVTRLDMRMLQALPQHSFTTHTPWYDQPVKFTGPLLADLLTAVKASGSRISAVAINDYRVNIPVSDATKHRVIVARLMNDRPMPVRDKGPLFVIYPFDSNVELRSSVYYERSIWQLKALDVQ